MSDNPQSAPTQRLGAEELAEIPSYHVPREPREDGVRLCDECLQDWPCDATRLGEHVAAQERELARLQELAARWEKNARKERDYSLEMEQTVRDTLAELAQRTEERDRYRMALVTLLPLAEHAHLLGLHQNMCSGECAHAEAIRVARGEQAALAGVPTGGAQE